MDSYVRGFGYTGGLVGAASSNHAIHGPIEINYSWVDINVSSTHPSNTTDYNIRYGGLVGYIFKGVAYDCFAYNNVIGGDQVGGIVGYLDNAAVARCYFSGSVTQNVVTSNPGIGAIVGNYEGNFPNNIVGSTGNNCAPYCYYPNNNPPVINAVDSQIPNEQGTGIDFTNQDNFETWDFFDIWSITDGLPILDSNPIQELPDYYYYTIADGSWNDTIWYKTTNPNFAGGFSSSSEPDPDKSLGIRIVNQVWLNQNIELTNLQIGASGILELNESITLTLINGSSDKDLIVEKSGKLLIHGSLILGNSAAMEVCEKAKVSIDEQTGGIVPGQNTNLIVNSEDFDFQNVGVDGFESPNYAFICFPPTNRLLNPFFASSTFIEAFPLFVNRKWLINGTALQADTSKRITLFWNAADDNYYDWIANNAHPVVYFGMTPVSIIDYDVQSNPRWVKFDWVFDEGTGDAKAELQVKPFSGETLPVELSAFNAQSYQGRSVKLMWQTQSETNVQSFSFYRGRTDILEDAHYLNVTIPGTNSSQPKSYIYYDREVFDPGLYYYWLLSTDFDGTSQLFGPINVYFDATDLGSDQVTPLPGFDSAYPNPFNPETTLRYGVDQRSTVELRIYNVRGQIVRRLIQTEQDVGWHQIRWDGRDDAGRNLSSGVYFARMHLGNRIYQHKLVMMK